MNIGSTTILSIIFSVFAAHASSEKEDDLRNLSYINARTEQLESGDQILVPQGVTTIPGLPIALSEQDLKATRAAARSLKRKGYVDVPGHLAIADNTLRAMREELKKHKDGSGKGFSTNVRSLKTFDFSEVDVGKVDSEILNSKSESYISKHGNDVFRVYSNTKFGNLYIHEMRGGRMGVVGAPDDSHFHVNGAEGYKTTVRYADGKMASLFILRTDRGVTSIEMGFPVSSENNYAAESTSTAGIVSHDVKSFIETLVTNREE